MINCFSVVWKILTFNNLILMCLSMGFFWFHNIWNPLGFTNLDIQFLPHNLGFWMIVVLQISSAPFSFLFWGLFNICTGPFDGVSYIPWAFFTFIPSYCSDLIISNHVLCSLILFTKWLDQLLNPLSEYFNSITTQLQILFSSFLGFLFVDTLTSPTSCGVMEVGESVGLSPGG